MAASFSALSIRTALLASIGVTAAAACGGTADNGAAPPPRKTAPEYGGFVRDGAGPWHRPTTGTCPNLLPDGDTGCNERPYGHFVTVGQGLPPQPTSICVYGCLEDSDCEDGFICRCGEPVGACVVSDCRTDDDCTSGALCVENRQLNPCGGPATSSFSCAVPSVECGEPSDCAQFGMACNAGKCMSGPVCGRPFLVQGATREAGAVRRLDWSAPLTPHVSELDMNERTVLAEHYAALGRMEHASIAAFARFALDLLSVGAPPSLIMDASAALADETAHTELCFGLASAYAGAPLGPGPLNVSGALDDASLAELAERTFIEGCIGETTAALEASRAAALATDPAVSAVLARIAADELRHAELAFRFVAHCLSVAGTARGELSLRLQAALRDASRKHVAGNENAPEPRRDDNLVRHGRLPAATQRDIAAEALRDVVIPCASALFAAEARTASARISASSS